uniref:Major facilitator superfamily (MFS) profile domain-containing protein n=1 Tax=Psilocybe cubensis TaxID=181762 RepID=A0A8H7XWM1_PSICU
MPIVPWLHSPTVPPHWRIQGLESISVSLPEGNYKADRIELQVPVSQMDIDTSHGTGSQTASRPPTPMTINPKGDSTGKEFTLTPEPTVIVGEKTPGNDVSAFASPSMSADGYGDKEVARSLTREQKNIALGQFLSLCLTLFLAGWNDGTTGPLLPRIQEVYKVCLLDSATQFDGYSCQFVAPVNFTIVSLIFVFACVGFLSGALANIYLTDKIGFGKAIVFGSICQVVAYSIQSSAPPFPVFVLAYVINGAGLALQDAQANGFVATLTQNPESKMGILHAAYGLGAFASPLVATQFAQLHRWSFHFLVSLGLAITNTAILIMIFKLKRQDDCLKEAGEIIPETTAEEKEQNKSTFKTVMRTQAVHLLAFFILVYVGVEVTIGGWIVTFIINVRGGGPSSGYISSGFFGGK